MKNLRVTLSNEEVKLVYDALEFTYDSDFFSDDDPVMVDSIVALFHIISKIDSQVSIGTNDWSDVEDEELEDELEDDDDPGDDECNGWNCPDDGGGSECGGDDCPNLDVEKEESSGCCGACHGRWDEETHDLNAGHRPESGDGDCCSDCGEDIDDCICDCCSDCGENECICDEVWDSCDDDLEEDEENIDPSNAWNANQGWTTE